ncbi:hypothetical protein PPYR_14628 [Photinus pyralis]|uniref:MARVEL domain-containing protein n=1 Tax=Photinus pyralis TaxID=7054 RepID=A0A1Y1MH06_PHOPY|nr:transmembrane protein 272-like [Photinus pyralis]KAB0792669.1 hypothetical protein PPYR_14628 [Photinus pyralis]
MESPTSSDLLPEKNMPIFDDPVKKQPQSYGYSKLSIVLQVTFFVLKLIMFISGVINVNDCPQQPMVHIYLIVTGILGVVTKCMYIINCKYEIKALHYTINFLRLVEFLWMIIGCYCIFSIYQPNYSPYFDRKYCDRHGYLTAFALLILHLLYFVCVTIMTLTKFSNAW